jgi:hypothetical protein
MDDMAYLQGGLPSGVVFTFRFGTIQMGRQQGLNKETGL